MLKKIFGTVIVLTAVYFVITTLAPTVGTII